MKILTDAMGEEEGRKTFYRFRRVDLSGFVARTDSRVFFMACAEFFALNGGETWGVGKYVFEKK